MCRISRIVIAGETLDLSDHQVVCFVGPNSSGKSTALRAISAGCRDGGSGRAFPGSVVRHVEAREEPLSDELLHDLESSGHLRNGQLYLRGDDPLGNLPTGKQMKFPRKYQDGILHMSVGPATRSTFFQGGTIGARGFEGTHPLQRLLREPNEDERFSNIVLELFGQECSGNWNADNSLDLRFGPRVPQSEIRGPIDFAYFKRLWDYKTHEDFGDGFSSAIGLLGQVLLSPATSYCIDEPDVYLHPPQAYEVARIMTREKENSQFFLATHSASFVKGLMDQAGDRLILVRLDKEGDDFSAKLVSNAAFKDIDRDPVLKFSSLVEGLFYKRQFICEDSADCLFYRHGLEQMGASNELVNGLWIGANGKTNIPKFANSAKKLAIEPSYVFDFDALRPGSFEKLLEIVGGERSEDLKAAHKDICKMVENDNKVDWKMGLKPNGLHATVHDQQLYHKFESLIASLREFGIIIVRFGEVESLCTPRVDGEGHKAVNGMLKLDFRTDGKLEKARKFVSELMN